MDNAAIADNFSLLSKLLDINGENSFKSKSYSIAAFNIEKLPMQLNNALQVKFSYAITCHKSQGGQWNTVFVEQPYLPNGIDLDYIRWLYTAVTRAKDKLYLIGFKDESFEH